MKIFSFSDGNKKRSISVLKDFSLNTSTSHFKEPCADPRKGFLIYLDNSSTNRLKSYCYRKGFYFQTQDWHHLEHCDLGGRFLTQPSQEDEGVQ